MSAKKRLSGTALAVAAAGFAGYMALATVASPTMANEDVKCYGVNNCKGQNDCAGEHNSCKGMGSCKGQGFLKMTKSDCDTKGGTVK